MELPIERFMRQASGRPDQVFDPKAPDALKLRSGKALTAIYTLAPEAIRAFAFDAEGGLHGIIVDVDDRNKLSDAATSYWGLGRELRGFLVYTGDDVAVLIHEIPKLKGVYQSKTGRPVPDSLPYWYRDRLVRESKLPLGEAILGADILVGWDPYPKMKGWFRKRFGSEYVILSLPSWGKDVTMWGQAPKSLSYDEWDEVQKATQVELDVSKMTLEDLDEAAAKVAAATKNFRPAREQKTYEDFEYGGKTGPAAFKAWKATLEREIVDAVKWFTEQTNKEGIDRRPLPTTKDIVGFLEQSVGIIDYRSSLSRQEQGKLVGRILKSLEKRKIVQQNDNLPGPSRWETYYTGK